MTDNGMATALVTGGASGIGQAVTQRWVLDGGRVAILDVDSEAVEKAIAELGPDRAIGRVADVRDAAQVDEAVAAMCGELGGSLDAVVNCAGIARPIDAAQDPDADWVRMIDIHLNGTMRVCRSAHPFLSQSDQAAIVNISSIAASNGLPGRSNYCAAKAGVEGLTRALAVEWSPGIRVNAIAPGYVQTPMIDTLVADGRLDTAPVIARTPQSRFCDPSEIASAIVYLASPQASFVTGQTLRVDGGLSIEGNWYGRRS